MSTYKKTATQAQHDAVYEPGTQRPSDHFHWVPDNLWRALAAAGMDPHPIKAWFGGARYEQHGRYHLIWVKSGEGMSRSMYRDYVVQNFVGFLSKAFGEGFWVIKVEGDPIEYRKAPSPENIELCDALREGRIGMLDIAAITEHRKTAPITVDQYLAQRDAR